MPSIPRHITLGLAAALLSGGMALAQTASGNASMANPGTTNPENHSGAADQTTTTTMPGMGTAGRSTGTNATVNSNGAVNTNTASQATPASGANSFTMGEARRRLQRHGYTEITGLKKDNNGVWRGAAHKNGQMVSVWLDYRGDVGQQP